MDLHLLQESGGFPLEQSHPNHRLGPLNNPTLDFSILGSQLKQLNIVFFYLVSSSYETCDNGFNS